MKKLVAILLLLPSLALAQNTYNYFPPPGMAYDGVSTLTLQPVTGTGFTLITPAATTTDAINISTGVASTAGAGIINIKVGNAVGSASHSGNCCSDLNLFAGSTANPTAGQQAGIVNIHGGSDTNAANGGDVHLLGGGAGPSATGHGGIAFLQGGPGSASAAAGDARVIGGSNGAGTGGQATNQAGSTTGGGVPGNVNLTAGNATSTSCTIASTCTGGDVKVTTGNTNSTGGERGGNLAIALGTSAAGTPGQVVISDATSGATDYIFDGNLRNFVATVQANTTGDTNGFLYMPAVAGVPTGVPANLTGNYANGSPTRYDTSDNRIYVYNGGWKEFNPVLTGTSASIGGGALGAGACASTATAVSGAAVGNVVDVTPNTYPGDSAFWKAYVSGANTVTVLICESVAATPTASTYNIRVFQ